MALTLGDNFSYQGAKPLDARLNYSTVAAMKAVADATMYNGCLAYCAGTDKTYQWKSTNTVDETTGKWREFQAGGGGGGGETYTAGDGIDISEENVISAKKSEAGWMDEVIEKAPMSGALVNIANAFNRSDLYSETERIVGQWIDGKPLYQKTIVQANVRNNYEFDLSSLSIDTFVYAYGMCTGSDGNMGPMTYVSGLTSGDDFINYWVDGTNKNVHMLTKSSTYTVTMIIRYTKTTDQAVSIGEANEYSTSEKIIGTWIDGKPLYQRTIKITDLSAISSTARGWYVVYSDSATKYGMVKVDFGSTFIEVSSNGVTYISPINEYIAESSSPVMYTSIRPDINDTTHALNIRVLNSGASQLRATDAILYITLQYTKTTD